ncbi:hypothetical protein C4573_01010 [Candidatus Woesearchaeota archaeon]|nr:MAG: hypothetical protein C4573_01010 [Candidatus Woesearchaeota archaeon]
MQHRNLTIIGTSHIARQSVKLIKEALQQKYDIVAVELDAARYQGLMSQEKQSLNPAIIRQIGLQGYLFAVIGKFVQKKLGNMTGVQPGSEMLTAVELAKKHHADVFLIDRPLQITLKRFSQKLSWKEKGKLFADVVSGIFGGKKMRIDLNKVPEEELIETLLLQLKERYPNMYLVLVEERNHYMASQLAKIMAKFPDKKILCVVGAGHGKELSALVEKKRPKFEAV